MFLPDQLLARPAGGRLKALATRSYCDGLTEALQSFWLRLGSQVVARVGMPWCQTEQLTKAARLCCPELCRFNAIVTCVLLKPVSV